MFSSSVFLNYFYNVILVRIYDNLFVSKFLSVLEDIRTIVI